MDLFAVLALVGGLALFLYGMNVMGGGLEKLAGGKLEKIFEKLTSNPLKAVLLGVSVTAVIQSSSATTVLLVGFVNAGIMKLHQAIGVIMGANIGTTVTSWLLSLSGLSGDSIFIKLLKPSSFSPVLAIIGVAILTFSKSGKKKDIATILVGFAVLMFGMTMMSDAVAPLKDVPEFAEILLWFKNPILGVLAGALLTAIIQSSSASVGILQALSATGAITFGSALPIILGQNIGTCVTAMLSSIGTSKNAKRVAVVHLYFNVIGTVLFLVIFYTLNAFIDFTFIDSVVGATQIAIVHTIFNFVTTFALLPFIKVLEKLAFLTVKDNPDEKVEDIQQQFRLLDDRFLQSPAFAIEKCRDLAKKMGELAQTSISEAVDIAMYKYDPAKAESVNTSENLVDMFEDKLGTYLVKLSSQDMSMKDSQSVSTLLHVIGDFERISDHAKNIVEVAQEKHDKQIEFSAQATAELEVICGAVKEILDISIKAFDEHDIVTAGTVEPLEEVVDELRARLKNRHVKRLQAGECTIELGFIFTDLLTNLERVSDHCSNIAICIIQADDENFDTHEYVKVLRNSGDDFADKVKTFEKQYALPSRDMI